MASAPQQTNLPLLYRDLQPLSSNEHGGWKGRPMQDLSLIADVHAIPLTVDEMIAAQRFHPIVFTPGDQPLPLALFGLNDGVNMYLDENNMLIAEAYLPAWVRRYPFMLVRLDETRDELSLCFDPASGLVGDFEEGSPLFVDGEPSDDTKGLLQFCEQFEMGAQKTTAFGVELKQLGLLIDSEVTINVADRPEPCVYRGFQMIDEQKLRDLRGDQLRKMAQNGMLPLIHAHMFSMQLMPMLFERQMAAGKVPTASLG